MTKQEEVLRALSGKAQAASPADLAQDVKTDEGSVRTYLSRLKEKGYAEGGGKEWFITEAGKKAIERAEGIPTRREDIGQDELSQFQYYGSLAGANPDTIAAATELFKNTDMRKMEEVERILAEINVPVTNRNRWVALYRGYLRNTTPPEKRDEIYPLPKVATPPTSEAGTGTREPSGGEGIDFIIEGTDIRRVEPGAGDFTFSQALQAVRAKRGLGSGGGGQGWSQTDIIALIDKVNEKRGEGATAKVYAFEQTEQGMVLKEVTPGTPLNLNPPGGKKENMLIIDSEGVVQEFKPGIHVGAKPPAGTDIGKKVTVVRQTDKGVVKEEYPTGEVIILNSPSPGSGGPMGLPFPVLGSDGTPVVDNTGRPVYANLEPMLRWLGFQGEQKRADERHQSLIGLVQTVRENVPDGIQALIAAAKEARGEGTGAPKLESGAAPQAYECGNCHTRFTLPTTEGWTNLKCPNPACGKVWSREEVMKT